MVSDTTRGILEGLRELAVILNKPEALKMVDNYIKENNPGMVTKKKIIFKAKKKGRGRIK